MRVSKTSNRTRVVRNCVKSRWNTSLYNMHAYFLLCYRIRFRFAVCTESFNTSVAYIPSVLIIRCVVILVYTAQITSLTKSFVIPSDYLSPRNYDGTCSFEFRLARLRRKPKREFCSRSETIRMQLSGSHST